MRYAHSVFNDFCHLWHDSHFFCFSLEAHSKTNSDQVGHERESECKKNERDGGHKHCNKHGIGIQS